MLKQHSDHVSTVNVKVEMTDDCIVRLKKGKEIQMNEGVEQRKPFNIFLPLLETKMLFERKKKMIIIIITFFFFFVINESTKKIFKKKRKKRALFPLPDTDSQISKLNKHHFFFKNV